MSQKLAVVGFKWRNNKFNLYEDFKKSYDENNEKGCIREVDVHYSMELEKKQSDLPFLSDTMNVNNWKLLCNLYDKKNFDKSSEGSTRLWINTRKNPQGNQVQSRNMVEDKHKQDWRTRTKAKNDFEKDFFKLMSHSVFQKTMENLRRHSGIRFVTIVV